MNEPGNPDTEAANAAPDSTDEAVDAGTAIRRRTRRLENELWPEDGHRDPHADADDSGRD